MAISVAFHHVLSLLRCFYYNSYAIFLLSSFQCSSFPRRFDANEQFCNKSSINDMWKIRNWPAFLYSKKIEKEMNRNLK